MEKIFKSEVLQAFQKESPSKIKIEKKSKFSEYKKNIYNLFFYKLKLTPELFRTKTIIDFGCGTGEMDIVLASWGGTIKGFDFNKISIQRANYLKKQFGYEKKCLFNIGDVDSHLIQKEYYDFAVSFGVIAHVPNQEKMFRRMAQSCKKGGFLVLGYIEDSGLIQRLLHRAIVRVNSDKSDIEIFKIAKQFFPEHIKRSVRYGGRSAKSVINDYLINPHYIGIETKKIICWAKKYGLEFYSSWPSIEIPFLVDSPYFKPISKTSKIFEVYLSFLRLRWLYAQDTDKIILNEIMKKLPNLSKVIDNLFCYLNKSLQTREQYLDKSSSLKSILNEVEANIQLSLSEIKKYIKTNLCELNSELLKITKLIIAKQNKNKKFNTAQINKKLFRGYNGLGTSYIVFHKKM